MSGQVDYSFREDSLLKMLGSIDINAAMHENFDIIPDSKTIYENIISLTTCANSIV